MMKFVKYILLIGLLMLNVACLRNKTFLNAELPIKDDLYLFEDVDAYDSYFDPVLEATKSSKQNAVAILNKGDDALLARIELIRKAHKTIYVQTFIWESDESARYFAWELAQAAKRGIKVKILLDALSIPEDPRLLDLFINSSPNLELRLYNPVTKNIKPSTLEMLISAGARFDKFNQRMHNKLFIVDNQIAIIGGRNYSNEYFDRGSKRIFKDTEVIVIGDTVNEMVDSFSDYWFFDNVVKIENLLGLKSLRKIKSAFYNKDDLELYALFDDLQNCLNTDMCTAKKFSSRYKLVDRVDFIADRPGKIEKVGKQKTSFSQDKFYNFLSKAKNLIYMRSPYLVVDRRGAKFFKNLEKSHPEMKVIVSSNSLAAADHPHAYAFAYKKMKKYLKSFKWHIFEFKPRPKDQPKMIATSSDLTLEAKHKITLHSKVYVVDDYVSWVGSYNLDPRSALLNTEASVIIHSERIAELLSNDIKRDIKPENSWVVAKRNKKFVVSLFHGLIYDLSKLVPFIDIWPYTYSGCFELKDDKSPLDAGSLEFYNHYDYVGPFPEVAFSLIEAQARFTKAFLGSAEQLI